MSSELVIDEDLERSLRYNRGLVVLSIDGGGVRSLSALLILKECMIRIQRQMNSEAVPEPYEHFDLIGGTGMGGVSAAMLGRLRMPLELVIARFTRLTREVFSDRRLSRARGLRTSNSNRMQQEIKEIVREATNNENSKMMDQHQDGRGCKTVVFAMAKRNMNAGLPRAFRSYQLSSNQMPDCAVWEALSATTANPDLFKSIDISDGSITESFVDGGLGCSNPLAHVLAEVKLAYPNRHVGCVISLGAGHSPTIHIPRSSGIQRLLSIDVFNTEKGIVVDSERVAQEMSSRFNGIADVYFRLNVDQGLQDIDIWDYERLDDITAHTRGYTHRSDVSERIDRLVTAVRNRRRAIATIYVDGQLPIVMGQPTDDSGIKSHPPLTSHFTGRERLVRQAMAYLLGDSLERKIFVIHGLGGAGKTQTALRIIEKTRDYWSDIIYADATSAESVQTSLKDFAVLRRIGDMHQNTLHWLASNQERWLLVLDNADDPNVNVIEYIPKCSFGSVLITTRNQELVELALGIGSDCSVSSMEPDESLCLLTKASRVEHQSLTEDELKAAKALLKDLGHFPLAIVHVGGYIRKHKCSFSQYRTMYQKKPEKMLRKRISLRMLLDGYEQTTLDTWLPSYALLSDSAKQLLWIMAFMKCDRITLDIFKHASLNIFGFEPTIPLSGPEECILDYVETFLQLFLDDDGYWDDGAFLDIIGEILSYSLISYDPTEELYILHPLVHTWARTLVQDTGVAGLHTAYVLAASSAWNEAIESEASHFHRTLQLHVSSVLQHITLRETHVDIAAAFANVFYRNGERKEAARIQLMVLEARRRDLGEEHPMTLRSMGSLAATYFEQGNLREAEELQVRVFETSKRLRGKGDRHTVNAMVSLAVTYYGQGRLVQAEELETHAVNVLARSEDHPDALHAMNNLAMTYLSQGRLRQAESLLVQVLDVNQTLRGEEDPDTLTAKVNLARAYFSHEKWDLAQKLEEQVLEARKTMLGEEHPDTLAAMSSLAGTHEHRGRIKEAQEMYTRVLTASLRVLGEDHPDTLLARNNLAANYFNQGIFEEAEKLEIEVLQKTRELHGERDPDTLQAMRALGVTYKARGSERRAEYEALEKQIQSLDKEIQESATAHLSSNSSSVPPYLWFLCLLAAIFLCRFQEN